MIEEAAELIANDPYGYDFSDPPDDFVAWADGLILPEKVVVTQWLYGLMASHLADSYSRHGLLLQVLAESWAREDPFSAIANADGLTGYSRGLDSALEVFVYRGWARRDPREAWGHFSPKYLNWLEREFKNFDQYHHQIARFILGDLAAKYPQQALGVLLEGDGRFSVLRIQRDAILGSLPDGQDWQGLAKVLDALDDPFGE